MNIAVILPAGGASVRYHSAGGLRSKLDEDMGGKPLLQRTVETFTKFDDDDVNISTLIVAGPNDDAAFREFNERHGDRLTLLGAKLVKGGKVHRWQTVHAAISHVPKECTHIAVHDAARPCISFDLMRRVFRAAKKFPAVAPAVACTDTLKRTRTTDEVMGGDDPVAAILGESPASKQPVRVVSETLDRTGLVLTQTPQVFEASLLRKAYDAFVAMPESKQHNVTDDAGVVELSNHRVVIVDGEARNIKVTLPEDVSLARALMGFKESEGRPVHKKF